MPFTLTTTSGVLTSNSSATVFFITSKIDWPSSRSTERTAPVGVTLVPTRSTDCS